MQLVLAHRGGHHLEGMAGRANAVGDIRGRAWRVDSDELWEAVHPGKVAESRQKYVLFEFSVDEARATRYVGEETLYSKWRRDHSPDDSLDGSRA